MKKLIAYLNRLFIDGLSGMALGLFSTLIIGTIIKQIGSYVPGVLGEYLVLIGTVASVLTGAGIGVGVAVKLKESAPLLVISSAAAGLVGAHASAIHKIVSSPDAVFSLSGPGEPLGAFVAAYIAIEIGRLVSGKTPVDIIVTPFVTILSGSFVGLILGPPISAFMLILGSWVNLNVNAHPIVFAMIVSALMGIFLTLPISSAAIGISIGLSGLAAGVATVGCCANMIGFAVASYRENKFGGFIAQGIGTSMLQMPNIVKKPIIWLPAIVSSIVIAPISTAFGMVSNPMGSGMGTAGLVGPINTYTTMVESGFSPLTTLGEIALVYFILPAVISLLISELMRKFNFIKFGDMKLDL